MLHYVQARIDGQQIIQHFWHNYDNQGLIIKINDAQFR
jgi:hypothetical protein